MGPTCLVLFKVVSIMVGNKNPYIITSIFGLCKTRCVRYLLAALIQSLQTTNLLTSVNSLRVRVSIKS